MYKPWEIWTLRFNALLKFDGIRKYLDTQNLTGIILAGGKSRRLGRDKAVENIGSKRIVDRVISSVSSHCRDIIVVGNDAARKDELALGEDIKFVTDLYPDKGSLGGLYSGLKASSSNWNFLFACDMPFISESVLSLMINSELSDSIDVVVFEVDGYLQTTHALYQKTCLDKIEKSLLTNNLKMSGYFDQVRLRKLSDSLITAIPYAELSFFNVNTEEDLKRSRSIFGDMQGQI